MRTRLLSIAALTAFALSTLAVPVAAGGPITRYVDDDGTAGSAGCDGGLAVPSSIQDAVDASGPGDRILVCAGTYAEQVDIAGSAHRRLTVKGVSPWTARVVPKDLSGASDDDAIIRVASNNVRVQWLKVVARTTGTCENAQFGIKVDGAAGAVIRANRVIASPKGDARNPGCGLTTAIAVWDGSSGAQVLNNLVRDFQLIGIQAHGAQDVKVKSNSVRYWHPLFGTAASRVTPANPQSTNGIRFYESTGRIARNAVSSTQGAGVEPESLSYAISSFGGQGVVVTDNLLFRVSNGIQVDGLDGGTIRRNRVTRDVAGVLLNTEKGIVLLDSTNNLVVGNIVTRFPWGIALNPQTSGNTVRDNDALGNTVYDCVDHSGDALPAIAPSDPVDNTWSANLGNADTPVGLCTDA